MILNLIGDKPITDRELMLKLREKGYKKSRPGFYLDMAKLEDTGLVEGKWESKTVNGKNVKYRTYKRKAK